MGYRLNREAMRVVEKNDKGSVVYRKRYRKGDEVDTSHMDDGHVQALIESGVLVESEDDVTEAESAGSISPTSGPFGAASAHQDGTTPAAPPVEPVQQEASETGDPDSGSVAANTLEPTGDDDPAAVDNNPTGEDEDEVEDVDRYSEMDYPALQKEAKSRNLNAGGSGDEIRARLREDDNS